eukprot:m51a1_g9804 putative lysine -aminomutase (849) ;mRNA; r:1810274-1813909
MFNPSLAVDTTHSVWAEKTAVASGHETETDLGDKDATPVPEADSSSAANTSHGNMTFVPSGWAVVGVIAGHAGPALQQAITLISRSLASTGHKVRFIDALGDVEVQLRTVQPDVCLNLYSAPRGAPLGDALIPAVVTSLGLPCVGAAPSTLALLKDRSTTLRALRDCGVRVPAFDIVLTPAAASRITTPWPLAVTSPDADGARVTASNAAELARAVADVVETGQPALVEEEYTESRVFAVGVMGNKTAAVGGTNGYRALGPLEVVANDALVPVVDLDPSMRSRIVEAALGAMEALRLNDFARVDVKISLDPEDFVDGETPVVVVAVRSLPAASPIPFFQRCSTEPLPALVAELIALALQRSGRPRAPTTASAPSHAEAPETPRHTSQDEDAYSSDASEGLRKDQVPPEKWNDWRWQFANRMTKMEQFERVLRLTEEEREAFRHPGLFPVACTPHFASLINPDDPNDPIRLQVLPRMKEFQQHSEDIEDSLGEDAHMPVKGLVHRYPDRVLMLVSMTCASYCRFCTRNRVVGNTSVTSCHSVSEADKNASLMSVYEAQLQYIRDTPAIRDVLLSGGDPLLIPQSTLEWLLRSLRAIPHVQVVRIGSRVPLFLPQRVTPDLCAMLHKYHPLWMNVHINHPNELCADAEAALGRLADAGIPLGSQTVLLAGVNDCPNVFKALVQRIVQCRVRPYYLYQCDLVVGAAHFRTPVTKGIELIESVRGHTSGFAVPTYVIDAPHGGGKTPVQPNYLISLSEDKAIVRNYEGFITTYTGPAQYHKHDTCKCAYCRASTGEAGQEGVAGLLAGRANNIVPANWEELHARAKRYQERRSIAAAAQATSAATGVAEPYY